MFKDFRLALQRLIRRPGFTLAAVGTLALGVGAAATIFSVIDAVLIEPLPFADPERLVTVWGRSFKLGAERDVISGPNFLDFRERNQVFEALAAYKTGGVTVLHDERPVVADGLNVTPGFFDLLGVEPVLGRTFDAADGQTGRTDVAVISYQLWRQRFGGAPDIIGRRVDVVDGSYRIIGVLPDDFGFIMPYDFNVPVAFDWLRTRDRTSIDYWLLGRLRPAMTVDHARTDLGTIMTDLRREDPRLRDWDIRVEPFQQPLYSSMRPGLLLLLSAVGVALIIACVNVANLLLARVIGRRREIAIRASLGASRVATARLLFAESVLLALAGGVGGLLLSAGAVALMPAILPAQVSIPGSAATVRVPAIEIDISVIAFALTAAVATAVFFSLAPLVQQWRYSPSHFLRDGAARSTPGRGTRRAHRALVTVQLALAVVLLSTTGFALRSTMTLLDVDPGLDPANVLTLYIGELNSRPDAERAAYYRQVLESVAAVPGVESVGINDYVPFQQEDDYEGFHVEGRPIDESYGRTEWRRVSADYFTTVGIRLLHGRAFTPADDESSPSVVVINQAFVERYFPDENPIGRRLVIHERAYAASEIVGIVADVRRRGLAVEAPPVMYVPFHRRPRPVVGLLARTDGDPRALVEPIQEAIWSVDGTQPIDRVLTMRDVLRASTAVPRLILGVIAAIAALALTLAAVGVFGVMSYAVNQRQRELAVRAALGASSAGLLSLVLGRGLKLAVAGALLGVVTGWLAIAALSRFFYAGEASHVAPYASAAILMTAVALLACYAPARRAGRAAPMQALRAE